MNDELEAQPASFADLSDASTAMPSEPTEEVPPPYPTDARALLREKAADWGMEFEWHQNEFFEEDDEEEYWDLYGVVPSGKDPRRVLISADTAERLLTMEPCKVQAFGELDGYIFGSGVEVRLENTMEGWYALKRMPWAANSLDESDRHAPWSIAIEGGPPGVMVHIGSCSERFSALTARARQDTMRVEGLKSQRLDGMQAEVQSLARNIAFEFDLKYRAGFTLANRRRPRPAFGSKTQKLRDKPAFPRHSYPHKALNLYWYGRIAPRDMPLLRYLAFYQVLEYFFPSFFRREIIERVREELRDPRFSLADDLDVSRIVALGATASHRGSGELEQLKATLRGCVSESTLRNFIDTTPRLAQSLSDKKTIAGVGAIALNDKGFDLRDQAAARIYGIRCRIVHTKSDSEAFPDLLLPFSKEAEQLAADVALVAFVAQKALISGAVPFELGR